VFERENRIKSSPEANAFIFTPLLLNDDESGMIFCGIMNFLSMMKPWGAGEGVQ